MKRVWRRVAAHNDCVQQRQVLSTSTGTKFIEASLFSQARARPALVSWPKVI